MNLNNVIVGTALILTGSLASCKKDNIGTTSPESTDVKQTAVAHMNLAQQIVTGRNQTMSLRVYFDDGDPTSDNFGCSGSGGNCLDDVIIIAPHYQLNQLFSAVATGNEGSIKDLINDNYTSLKTQIDPLALNAVTNGTYTLKERTGSGNKTCLIFTNKKSGIVELVYSFINK